MKESFLRSKNGNMSAKLRLKHNIYFARKASRRLKSLKPVFRELRFVHQDYINGESRKDCPYWYSERPQIGFFAAAVWRSGFTALEEYRSSKKKIGGDKLGRCDLYVNIQGDSFECEAKRLWLELGEDVEPSVKRICHNLNWAGADVKKLKSGKGLALCFVTPVINTSKRNESHFRMKKLIGFLKKLLKKPRKDHIHYYDALVCIKFNQAQNLY